MTPSSGTLGKNPPPHANWDWQSRADKTAFCLLLSMVMLAPWPLGSNRQWAVGVLAIMAWSGVLLCSLTSTSREIRDVPTKKLNFINLVPMAGLVGFATLLSAQLIPGIGEAGKTISLDPFQTKRYLLTTSVYIGVWWLVLVTVRSRERGIQLLGTIVSVGVLQACTAVLLYSSGSEYDLFFTSFIQGDRATGTYPNPDHLAGLMELCISGGLGWLLSQFGQRQTSSSQSWRKKIVGATSFIVSNVMLLRLLIIAMVIALVMTHSRMGNGAFFLAMTVTGGVVAIRSRKLRRPALWLVISVSVIDLVIVGQWVGLDRLVSRIQNTAGLTIHPANAVRDQVEITLYTEETLAQRLVIPRLALKLALDRPWFGHGGGSFATTFPPYKETIEYGQSLYWDHAHNDYIQVACDTGFVGLCMWLLPGIATLCKSVTMVKDGNSKVKQAFAIGTIMALTAIGLHSFVDFNLHIPANALILCSLSAGVWATSKFGPV